MSDFEVRTDAVIRSSEQFSAIARQIKKISSETNSVLASTRSSISARIASALQRGVLCTNITNCAMDLDKLSQSIRAAMQIYINYERNVLKKNYSYKKTTKNNPSIKDRLDQFFDSFGKSVKKKAKDVKNKLVRIKKNILDGIQDGWNRFKTDVKNTYHIVKNKVETTIDYIKDNYANHGWVYKTVQYGKAVIKTAGGIAKMAGGIAAILGSYGTATPISVCSIISGFNSTVNGISDIINLHNDNYDAVGNVNFMKEGLEYVGSKAGSLIGGEQAGKIVGDALYYSVEITSAIGSLQNAKSAWIQNDKVNMGNLGTELKSLPENMSRYLTSDVKELTLQWKLLQYEIPETLNAIKKVQTGIDLTVKSGEIVSQVNEYFSSVSDKTVPTPTAAGSSYAAAKGAYDTASDFVGAAKDIVRFDEFSRGATGSSNIYKVYDNVKTVIDIYKAGTLKAGA